jgi:hypothetical protein
MIFLENSIYDEEMKRMSNHQLDDSILDWVVEYVRKKRQDRLDNLLG